MSTIDNKIVLNVKPSTRTISYEGSLVLGVRGDDCAERVYFECPKYINEMIDDITDESVSIFIDYKDAASEPFIQECTDVAVTATNEDVVQFSWIITNAVTSRPGEVMFNICIKKVADGALKHEWHTTPFKGKVLDSVRVTKKTPEVITHDTLIAQNLITAVNNYKQEVADYSQAVKDMNSYIDNKILEQSIYIGEFSDSYFDSENDYLAEYTTPGVYTFCVKGGFATSYNILVVAEYPSMGSVLQSVYTNLTSAGMYYQTRYSSNGVWSSPTTHNYVFQKDITRKYEDIVSVPTTGNVKNLEGDFVFTLRVTRPAGTSTTIVDKEDNVIQSVTYNDQGTYEFVIKGYQLDTYSNEYYIETSASSTNGNCTMSKATGRVMTIRGSGIRMWHSDYITDSNDKCCLITNIK